MLLNLHKKLECNEAFLSLEQLFESGASQSYL